MERDEEIDFSTNYVLINGHRAHPRRLLAKFKSGGPPDSRDALLQPFDLRVKTEFALTPGIVVLDSTKGTPLPVANADEAKARGEEMLDRIKALIGTGRFDYVEPDYIHQFLSTPSDSAFANGTLWGLRNTGQNGGVFGADIDVVRAWDLTTGSTDVIVAVIDTGIRYTHTDLAAQMWRNPGEIPGNGIDDDHDGYVDNVFGINAITGSGDPMDVGGHGTHCAGTIGAASNGSGQHVGVAWHVRLMGCKFLGAAGGATSDAIKCINFAVSKGARILSASWGGGPFEQSLLNAIAAARDRGVLFIAAAGNGGPDKIGDNNDVVATYPANYAVDNIISVAAIDRQDKLGAFSNYGSTSVHIGAPGVEILSTISTSDSSYESWPGTSMATPHVAGVAALVLARFPNITVAELRQRILLGAVPTPALRNKTTTGGRLNAYNAVSGGADGTLEVAVAPANGSELVGGTNVSFAVQVTDALAVQNATVTGIINGQANVVFANNGVAPDATANDHIYSASITVPNTTTTFSVRIDVSAPGKVPSSTTYTFPVRLAPANDVFAQRISLTGNAATATGSNVGASKEAGEPNHVGNAGGKSVWWTWTAPTSGTATIKTDGSNFDTMLAVYSGSSVAGLSAIATDDDSGAGSASLVSFNAVSGVTYQIAVDGFNGASGAIALDVSLIATPSAPANDNFASSVTISGTNATANGSNLGATKQAGELNHGGNSGGRSVWWRWTAPASGVAVIGTDGSLFDTTLGVYIGAAVSSLTTIASDNDSGEGARSLVVFNATAGTTYHIAVDGFNGASGNIGLAVILVIPPPAPANDNFANRVAITGFNTTATGTNVGATKEVGEADHAGNSGGRSVWWTWVAPSNGTATVTTAGSSVDTLLAVYSGSAISALTLIAGNDQDPAGGNTSRVTFNATAGSTYHFAVDGTNTGLSIAAGTISLNLALTAAPVAPANDNFANRITIIGSSVTVTGSNVGATKETSEPSHAGNGGGRSVWWTWTAPSSGVATIKTEGSGFDTLLGVYTGSAVSALATVAQNDDFDAGTTSLVTFNAVSGVAYRIAVDGFLGGSGAIALNVTLVVGPPAPANDAFANRIAIAGSSGTVTGSNNGATKEVGELNHANDLGGRSVWWSWTAPQTGRLSVTTLGSSFDTLLAVYKGTSIGVLTLVAADDESGANHTSAVSVFVSAGTTYAFAVDGWRGASGKVSVNLSFAPNSDLYATDFEVFPAGNDRLAGFDGWQSTHLTGGLSGTFPGFGTSRTGFLGFNPTQTASVFVWRPINYDPVAAGTPWIYFVMDLEVRDSTNANWDRFEIRLFNQAVQSLGAVVFDNQNLRVYREDGVNGFEVGTFANGVRYRLIVIMSFEHNVWAASLNGTTLFSGPAINTQGRALNLGDIDLGWRIRTPGASGDNFLIFDNYQIAVIEAPVMAAHPGNQSVSAGQAATLVAGATGSPSPSYQWQRQAAGTTGFINLANGVNYSGVTTSVLTVSGTTLAMSGDQFRCVASNGMPPNATSNAAVVTVTKAAQTIAFTVPANRVYGAAPFGVTVSASSGLPVAVSVVGGPATINETVVSITGAGVVTLLASQSGDANFNAATAVERSFTVAKAPLTVTADSKFRFYGAANPSFSLSYAGFVNNETVAALTTTPGASTVANATSNVGVYAISPSGGVAANYDFAYVGGALTITRASLTAKADDKTKIVGAANPALTVTYTGFVNGENGSVIDTAPTIATTATISSSAGTYPITLTGGSDNNYALTLQSGTLTVIAVPEIDVQGRGISIASGDAVPDIGDDTDFGAVAIGGSVVTHVFTLKNTGSANLNLTGNPVVAVSGANTADFAITQPSLSALPAGTQTTFDVTFAPSAAGMRTAVVNIANNDNDENPYTFSLMGTGVAVGATHAVIGPGYIAGNTVTVSNSLTYLGAATGLKWQVLLPVGWTFAADGGSAGNLKPEVGTADLLEWTWSSLSAASIAFTYTLNVPSGQTGEKLLQALAIVRRAAGDDAALLVKPDPLRVSQITTHSADTDRDFQISLFELTRVIELYNTRNGTVRTGCYKLDATGEDGFAADATRGGGSIASLVRHHSADTRGTTSGSPPDGAIDLFELTRVIELYNTRAGTVRTGRYHRLEGTEDGFAAGP